MAFFFQGLKGAGRRRLGVPVIAAAGACEWHRSKCDAPAADAELPALVQQAEEERKKQTQLKPPGAYESLIEEGKRLCQADTFQGFRLDVQKQVTPQFLVGHSLMLNPQLEMDNAKSIYNFTTQTHFHNGSMLMARYGHGGAVDGRYILGLGEVGVIKLIASMAPTASKDSFVAEAEVNGPDWTGAARLMLGAKQLQLSYTQAITPNLVIGCDSFFDGNELAGMFGAGGKYSTKDWAATFMTMHGGQVWFLQYVRRVVPGRMSLVADLTCAPQGNSQAVLGAEVNMKQSRLLTTIDSDLAISSTLECRVVPHAISMLLSAKMHQATDKYEFGYGFQLNL